MLRKNEIVMNQLMKAMKFVPHEAQKEILDAFLTHRFVCVVAGRRFGKSKIASILVEYGLLEKDCKILCVSKTYKLAKKVWNYVIKDAKKLFRDDISINKSEMVASTIYGSSVELGSADNPDSLLGDAYDVVVVDEAATLSEKIWQQNILPMIRDRKGTVVLITTPRGYNWVYDRYEDGQNSRDGWWSTQASSFNNTKVYDAEEIELVRNQSEKIYYEQEYLALFRAFADQVYSDFSRERHVVEPKDLPKDFKDWDVYLAIDPGYAQMCAMIWIGRNRLTGESIIFREHLAKQMRHSDVLAQIIKHEPEGGYTGLIMDVAGKQRTGESGRSVKSYLLGQTWFQDREYTISTKRYSIISGVNKVRANLLNVNDKVNLRVLSTCIGCIKMFENLHYTDGNVSEEPFKDGIHDHPADAIRYYVEYIDKTSKVYDHINL